MKQTKLSLLILAFLIPMMSNADPVEIDGIYYFLDLEIKEAEVKSNPNMYSGEVVIPETVTYDGQEYSVTSISPFAFENCENLTSIIIPNSVTTIGFMSFNHCSGLTSVTISNSVTSIDYGTFGSCTGLTSITIPNSVTTIGMNAFYNCSSLTSVYIPNSVTTIEYMSFYGCSGLTSVTIPNSVTSISSNVFGKCSGLTSLSVEAGNTKYDSRENCNAIIETETNTLISGTKNTIIPNSVTSISYYAFFNCSGLTSVTIPDIVTSIDVSAFDGCSNLTSITIPNSVTAIGEYAFYGCSSLTSVTVESKTPITISDNTFSNRGNATLYVPAGSKAAYQAADYWKEFKEIRELEPVYATWTDSNGMEWSFTVCGTEAKDIKPACQKIYIYGADPVQEPPFQPGTRDAAAMRFSSTEGAHLPTIPDDVYFGLKTLIFDISDADGVDMKVMNGWWSNTYYDHVVWVTGLNELQITEDMAKECAKGGEGRDLDLMLYGGTMTLNSVYYEE